VPTHHLPVRSDSALLVNASDPNMTVGEQTATPVLPTEHAILLLWIPVISLLTRFIIFWLFCVFWQRGVGPVGIVERLVIVV